MIRIDDILPEIRSSARRRTESTTLAAMNAEDLRSFIYKLVERDEARRSDLVDYFTDLVGAAEDRQGDLAHAMERSIGIRTSFLRMLLDVLEPALPLLAGSVVIESTKDQSSHEERTHHPILHGVELIDGEKEGSVSPGCFVRSGTSWWLVGMPPDGADDPALYRYAKLHHTGRRDDQRSWTINKLELASVADAARQIRDSEFRKILHRLHDRLLALQAEKVTDRSNEIMDAAKVLDAGLQAMGDAMAGLGNDGSFSRDS